MRTKLLPIVAAASLVPVVAAQQAIDLPRALPTSGAPGSGAVEYTISAEETTWDYGTGTQTNVSKPPRDSAKTGKVRASKNLSSESSGASSTESIAPKPFC